MLWTVSTTHGRNQNPGLFRASQQQHFMRMLQQRPMRGGRPKQHAVSSSPSLGLLLQQQQQPQMAQGMRARMAQVPLTQTGGSMPIRMGGVMGPNEGGSPLPPGALGYQPPGKMPDRRPGMMSAMRAPQPPMAGAGGAIQQTPGSGLINNVIGQFQREHDRANAANEQRYGQLLGLHDQRYNKAMNLADVAQQQQYKHAMAATNQDLMNRGLRASSLAGTGSHNAYEQSQQIPLNVHMQMSGDKLGMIERREDIGPDMGMMANLAMAASQNEMQNQALQMQMQMLNGMMGGGGMGGGFNGIGGLGAFGGFGGFPGPLNLGMVAPNYISPGQMGYTTPSANPFAFMPQNYGDGSRATPPHVQAMRQQAAMAQFQQRMANQMNPPMNQPRQINNSPRVPLTNLLKPKKGMLDPDSMFWMNGNNNPIADPAANKKFDPRLMPLISSIIGLM